MGFEAGKSAIHELVFAKPIVLREGGPLPLGWKWIQPDLAQASVVVLTFERGTWCDTTLVPVGVPALTTWRASVILNVLKEELEMEGDDVLDRVRQLLRLVEGGDNGH